MKERPILMSGPMVRACLRDTDPKTQTRRLVKREHVIPGARTLRFDNQTAEDIARCFRSPYGVRGARRTRGAPMERAGQRHARYGMGGRGNSEDFARAFKAHHAPNVQPSLFTKEKTQ